ncbi:MAG TPA: NlpC/P60 family protein [Armatimonadota bacterium]|jgi:hypothetical protein
MSIPTSAPSNAPLPAGTSFQRRAPALGWYVLVAVLVLLWLCPIRSGTLRNAILADAALVWVVGLLVWRRRAVALVLLAVAAVLVLAIAFVPGRPSDPRALRDQYVTSLRGYEGIRYVWGGENHRGVDCSGLVRGALAEAEFRLGARTLNPALLRGAFALWRNDATAMSLRDGYNDRARRVDEVRTLNNARADLLAPGDFAVTPGGNHTLAYLGGGTWIAADPMLRVVKTYRSPDTREFWLSTRLIILRWRVLEP